MIEILEPIFQPEESELMAMPNLLHEPIPSTLTFTECFIFIFHTPCNHIIHMGSEPAEVLCHV